MDRLAVGWLGRARDHGPLFPEHPRELRRRQGKGPKTARNGQNERIPDVFGGTFSTGANIAPTLKREPGGHARSVLSALSLRSLSPCRR
jgi:hypothetical protein